MAFSTQKDFFQVPFMNESPDLECKKASVKLKSYESTIDHRSWATDEMKRSKFLSDLVTCQSLRSGGGDYTDLNEEYGMGGVSSGLVGASSGLRNASTGIGGVSSGMGGASSGMDEARSGMGGASSGMDEARSGMGRAGAIYGQPEDKTILGVGDSLLQCANIHMAEYQKLMNIKTTLEKQLDVSNERLKTAKEENQQIRQILANKLDFNTSKDFYNKIQKLISASKLSKNEENEMLQIYQKMENMNKAYEILQAENYYLKRTIEKLDARVSLEKITTQPERSSDVVYLQNEVNKLRKECIMLRQVEEAYQKTKQQNANKTPASISEQDVENIKAIIKERNSLREKCQSLKKLEQKVGELEKKADDANRKAQDAHKKNGELSSTLNKNQKYINNMEGEMKNMQQYYEEQNQNGCFREECLKSQLEDLKEELIRAKCEAQKADMLAMEVSSLRNEVLKRDLALNDYDCQYKQLMDVVQELQCAKLQCLQENETQSTTDDLAFYTCATLEEILKKEKNRKGYPIDDKSSYAIYGLEEGPIKSECYQELQRLKHELEEMEKQKAEAANCLRRLKELESENQTLSGKLKEGEAKMSNMLAKIERLDRDINKTGMEADKIGKDLAGTMGLVKDISDVQLKNQQLANAVSAINSRDDQKIIDDLRRQLEEELAKLKKCQQDNNKLQEEAKQRDMELKELKDVNNKLEADRQKLEMENKKLFGDNGADGKAKKKGNIDLGEPEKLKIKTEKDVDKDKDKGKDPGTDKDKESDKNKQKDKGKDEGKAPERFKETDKFKQSDKDKQTDKEKDKDKQTDKEKYKETDKGKDKDKGGKKDKAGKDVDKDEKHLTGKDLDTKDKISKSEISPKDDTQLEDVADSMKKDSNENKRRKIRDDISLTSPAAALDDSKSAIKAKISSAKSKDKDPKVLGSLTDKAAALDDFVYKKSDSLKTNLQKNRCFEKEFRNILEEFIHECGYCFCRLFNAKSKLYIISHKLCHSGIETLSFRELAYVHKKIYAQAEQLLPGCLLDMILSDHKEQVVRMLNIMPLKYGGDDTIDFKMSESYIMDADQKCCCCKNDLCCNNSEEMLKDKVNKLEKDIETAREYLETLRNIPFHATVSTENDDSTDTNSTYRASNISVTLPKSRTTKHFKKLKARLMKSEDII